MHVKQNCYLLLSQEVSSQVLSPLESSEVLLHKSLLGIVCHGMIFNIYLLKTVLPFCFDNNS